MIPETQLVAVSSFWTIVGILIRTAFLAAFVVGAFYYMTREVFIPGELRFFRILIFVLGAAFLWGGVMTVILAIRRLMNANDPLFFVGEGTVATTVIIVVCSLAWILIYGRRHD